MRTDVRTTHAMAAMPVVTAGGWLARRWYYTPKTRRAYSVRQVSPGDRRLLAEFAMSLGQEADDGELECVRELSDTVFERVLASGAGVAIAYEALEGTTTGDRVIGVAAYAPITADTATFIVAVTHSFRDEQVGRTLLSTLIRHAKRVGIRRLSGGMDWSNRPMQKLAQATGFSVEPVAGDRNRRNLVLTLKY